MMRNRIASIALAGLVLAGAGIPSIASGQADVGKNVEAREALGALGKCLAVVRAAEVAHYLRDPGEDTWYRVTAYSDDEAPCVQLYSVVASQPAMRGAAAESWYLINYPSAPAAFAAAENTAPPQAETAKRIVAASEEDRPQVIIEEFARCVAATMPLEVDKLLRTPVASTEEAGAIRALSGGFPACAFEGQKLGFDAETLRAALAYAIARRAMLRAPA